MMDDVDSVCSDCIMSSIVAFLRALRYSCDGTALGVVGTCYSLLRSFKYLFDERPASPDLSGPTPRPTHLPTLVRSPSSDTKTLPFEKALQTEETGKLRALS